MSWAARTVSYARNRLSYFGQTVSYKALGRKKLANIGIATSTAAWKEARQIVNPFLEELPSGVSGFGGALEGIFCTVRTLRPTLVVETGVANGVSSTIILEALSRNQSGTLYSIDLPGKDPSAILPSGCETGWLVPERLRHRWRLLMGETSSVLPELLSKLGTIQMFYHDSDHQYDNMMFEFSSAWKHLENGGIIISDNTDLNPAFKDFCSKVRCINVVTDNVGFALRLPENQGTLCGASKN